MNLGIVTGELERDRIAVAAHDGELALVGRFARVQAGARLPGKTRPLVGEGHFELRSPAMARMHDRSRLGRRGRGGIC
jgi:hypothetical protein